MLEEAPDQHPEGAIAVIEDDPLRAALQNVDLLTQDEVFKSQTVAV